MKKANVIFLFFFAITNILLPIDENIGFRNITVEQGLTSNAVLCILQDRKGFMWFGTDEGLNKYDGYNVKQYQHDSSNTNSLSSNFIYSICEDKSGMIWIGTAKGLDKFDSRTEKFYHYKAVRGSANNLSFNFINTIYADKTGTIWIGAQEGGLIKFNPGKNQFSQYKNEPGNPNSLSNNNVTTICEDNSGILWVGTMDGFNKFDPQKETFILCLNDAQNPGTTKYKGIQSVCRGKSGNLWICSNNRDFLRFKPETGQFNRLKVDPVSLIRRVYEDRSGILWLGTRTGVIKLNTQLDDYTHYLGDQKDNKLLNDNIIFSIYEDRSELLWFGTSGAGLFVYDRNATKFTCYRLPSRALFHSMIHNSAVAITEDISGKIWIGTAANGVYKLDPQGEQFCQYMHNPQNPNTLGGNNIMAMCSSRKGVLWFGCSEAGLDKFNPQTGKLTHYKMKFNNSSPPRYNNIFYKLYEDRSGILWLGTDSGLHKFDPVKEKFTWYSFTVKESNHKHTVWAICEDKSGMLWVGTYFNGLYKFDREKEEFTNYKNEPGNPESLSCNTICSIHEDKSGTLWIGTQGGGLNKFARGKGIFSAYTCKDGLPNNNIFGILEDSHGNLWLSTRNGISRFAPEAGTFKNYTPGDGLQGTDFHVGSYCKTRQGKMYFGGIKGINAFFPEEIKDNPFIPPVVITNFKVFNRDYLLEKNILDSYALKLNYNDSFSFEFAALCFSRPDKNQYAYMLEDIHNDWINLGKRREVVFANLPPGHYKLKVKAANHDGVWNEEGTALTISILPPFWQTWWFKVFAVSLIIIISFYWHKKRMTRLTRKLKTEAAIERFFLEHRITGREREIICLILTGKSNKDIEDSLYISMGTVKNHIYSIYKKLHVKNRVQLVNLFKNLQIE